MRIQGSRPAPWPFFVALSVLKTFGPDTWTLILSDRERAELIEYLRSADKPSIRDIVERLRAFTV